MLELRALFVAAAIGMAIGASGAWKLTASYKDASWMASIGQQKVEAARQLQEATDKALASERGNVAKANKLEKDNVQKQTALDGILADNHRLAAELGGLRDPGRRTSCDSAVPTGTGGTGNAAVGSSEGRLSAEASQFLLDFARDADRAAQYANTCHDWIGQVK